MAFKLVESAQARWRAVNAPHLVALVRAGARSERGQIIKREKETAAWPWHVRALDDDHAMSLVAVSTQPDTGRGERWPDFDHTTMIAATLIQQPRYVDIGDGRPHRPTHDRRRRVAVGSANRTGHPRPPDRSRHRAPVAEALQGAGTGARLAARAADQPRQPLPVTIDASGVRRR